MRKPSDPLSVADQIKRGLEDGLLYARGELELCRTEHEATLHPLTPQEIMGLRESLDLDRKAFALALNVSERTLKSWESGEHAPSQTSLSLLYKLKDQAEVSRAERRVASKTRQRKGPRAVG